MIFGIAGPTGTGKTALAETIASRLPVEIISVDSANVYKGMDIGTAKPSLCKQRNIPHHLIDILKPTEKYNAVQFVNDVNRVTDQILNRGNIPLAVGGTMLYYRALIKGIDPLPSENATVRQAINKQGKQFGWHYLHRQLAKMAPAYAANIEPNDTQRIQRALEILELDASAGNSDDLKPYQSKYPVCMMALLPGNRAKLHNAIEKRFHRMLDAGFLDEVKSLIAQYHLDLTYPAMRSVGYRQAWHYWHDQLSYDRFVHKAIVASRQLAKRQLTWIRNWPFEIKTYDPFANNRIADQIIANIQSHLNQKNS